MNILIIEDEPRAANQLEKMLGECGFRYNLLQIIDTVEDASEWFQNNTAPDLIFLDIQLADGLSFEIFQKVKVDAPIIFTTAFDQYAIQAFKLNSIDYLLKPIQKDELNAALEKFNKSKIPTSLDPSILSQLLASMQAPEMREGILVKDGGGQIHLKVSDLLYMYSEDSFTFGMTSDKRHLIDETIDQLFSSLNPKHFYKINRGQIVSKKSVKKITPYLNHRVKLSIINGGEKEFIVSRQKTSEFKTWMNQ